MQSNYYQNITSRANLFFDNDSQSGFKSLSDNVVNTTSCFVSSNLSCLTYKLRHCRRQSSMDIYCLEGVAAHTGNFPTLGKLEPRQIYPVEPFYHACQLTMALLTHSLPKGIHRNEPDCRKQPGATLRYFREKRNISLNKVALEWLEFHGVTPWIEIEKGRRHPTLQKLRKIGDALQLTATELTDLKGLADYRPETWLPPLPPQIKEFLARVETVLGKHLYCTERGGAGG